MTQPTKLRNQLQKYMLIYTKLAADTFQVTSKYSNTQPSPLKIDVWYGSGSLE